MATSLITPYNSADNKQPYLYGVIYTVYFMSVVATILRLLSRKVSKAGFAADDYTMVIAMVFNTAILIIAQVSMANGCGRHLQSLPQFSTLMKITMAGEVLWTCTVAVTKISILLFYMRIFGHVISIRRVVYLLLGLTILWCMENVSLTPHEHIYLTSENRICRS